MAHTTPPLVDQPSSALTRKLSANLIAEAITAVVLLLGALGLNVEVSADQALAWGGAAIAIVSLVGTVVGYFTRNRAV